MRDCTRFFAGYAFTPFVSFVISREGFLRWKVKDRTIEDHELVLITDGRGHLLTSWGKTPCQRGTLLYLHEDFRHSIVADPESPISFSSVHFSYLKVRHSREHWEFDEDVNYYLKEASPKGDLWSVNSSYEKLPFPNSMDLRHYNMAKDLFFKLNYSYANQGFGHELQLNALLLELIHLVFKEIVRLGENDENRRKLDMARDYIDENYQENIALSQLTEHLSVSESFLIKLFKKNTGLTPIPYINQVRVNKGKDLLLNTNLSIKEIARDIGFCDEFYFSRTFKKIAGMSPARFRKQI